MRGSTKAFCTVFPSFSRGGTAQSNSDVESVILIWVIPSILDSLKGTRAESEANVLRQLCVRGDA